MNRKLIAHRVLVMLITCLFVSSLTGCAAKVGVMSVPGGAHIIVDGEETQHYTSSNREKSRIKLPQGKHEITVRKEGYNRPLEKKVAINVDGTQIFFLCALPPIGALMALFSGTVCEAYPRELVFELERETVSAESATRTGQVRQAISPPPAPPVRYYRVYLKNGSIIAGQLISIDPVRGYVLRLNDNSEVVFPQADVEKLVVE